MLGEVGGFNVFTVPKALELSQDTSSFVNTLYKSLHSLN